MMNACTLDPPGRFHDPLTGLPNEALLLERISERSRRPWSEPFAVFQVDVDYFRLVVEGMGYDAGDRLLQEIARRLEQCVGPGDTAARLRADRFALLVERLEEGDAAAFGEHVLRQLAAPLILDGRELSVQASAGFASSSGGFLRSTDLLRFAESALHRSKRFGRYQVQRFQPCMHEESRFCLEIVSDLRSLIREGQLELRYQPLLDLGTGRVTALEALVRWRHPRRGLLRPKDFLGIARRARTLGAIDRWVLDQACRQVQVWRQMVPGMEDVAVSVNMGAGRLSEPSWYEAVERTLGTTGLPADLLRLEITEGAAVKLTPETLSQLPRLETRGVGLWIDDFGTGFCGLTYLSRLPSTALKIDRSFVAAAVSSAADEEILRGIVELAHRLGKKVIAEGVETSLHRVMLEELGCDWAQGRYFAGPLPAAEVPAYVKSCRRPPLSLIST